MQTETIMVRRAATVSEADARARLGDKYPGWDVTSFKIEEEDGDRYFVATLDKTAEHPPVGIEDVGPPEPPAEGPDEGDSEEPEPPKEEKSESSGVEAKLDKLLDMMKTLVHGGDDEDPPADKAPLPPPVKEPLGMGGMGMSPFHGKLHLVVAREDDGIKLAAAKAELDEEFGPHGFRVAKMVRKDKQVVAALVRANDLPPFMKKDDEDKDDKSDKKDGEKSDDNPVKNDHWLDKSKKEDDDK